MAAIEDLDDLMTHGDDVIVVFAKAQARRYGKRDGKKWEGLLTMRISSALTGNISVASL